MRSEECDNVARDEDGPLRRAEEEEWLGLCCTFGEAVSVWDPNRSPVAFNTRGTVYYQDRC